MRRRFALAALLLALVPVPTAGQAWDTPSFFSPRPGEDIGLYVLRPEGVDDFGFAAIWRMEGNLNLGVRAGLAPGDHFLLGAEFFGPLDLLGPGSGLLMSWVLGFGAGFNDVTTLRVPLGLSAGFAFGTPGAVQIIPYAHPRVAFDLSAVQVAGREETETEFRFLFDLGADARLGESFVIRVGATIGTGGDPSTFGAGVAYRLTRRLIVR